MAYEIESMEQSLNGVMFHLFYADLFEALEIEPFEILHLKQSKEEEETLNKNKSKYIKKYKKIPSLKASPRIYEEKYSKMEFENLTKEEKQQIVKESFESYLEWETKALQNFSTWGKFEVVKKVLKEIETVKYILKLLSKYDYDYEKIF